MALITPPKASPFRRIVPYVNSLRELVVQPSEEFTWVEKCHAALNGEAGRELRSNVSIKTRRKFGVFFTGSVLSESLLKHLIPRVGRNLYYDPTCGMGDLLLAAANLLSLEKSLQLTLQKWGEQLAGTDLHPEFIDAAKLRLLLLARSKHGPEDQYFDPNVDYFPRIRVADALKDVRDYQEATHILMNPPFGAMKLGSRYSWTSGSMTAAAVFVMEALKEIGPDVQILAVLPEVLRSGTFSGHWREAISKIANINVVSPHGIFDESADIDVFILSLSKRDLSSPSSNPWPGKADFQGPLLRDRFEVHVGRVVPFRDKKSGQKLAYIHPRSLQPWSVLYEIDETRCHGAAGYLSPFVAIRRTSRPDQPFRAIATVVAGKREVFVENHLIVCQPKDGKLSTCVDLMKKLKTENVNLYLNERIRCRHLTVGAVADIPLD